MGTVDPFGQYFTSNIDTGLPSVCGYHESIEDLKHKILRTSLELERIRVNASDEIRKSDETISQLLHIVKAVSQERDDARVEMQLLLNQMMMKQPSIIPTESPPPPPPPPRRRRQAGYIACIIPEPAANLSGSPNQQHYSNGSSSAESAIDDVNSPELFSMNIADSGDTTLMATPPAPANYNRAQAIIDGLAGMRPVPEKGKLVQAVLDAGPLLKDLLIAGQLPQWRNPPPMQSFHVPPPLSAVAAPNAAAILNIQNAFLNQNQLMPRVVKDPM